MLSFGLLFPFIGNIIFLSMTGGWNKDLSGEVEMDEEESGEVEVGLIFQLDLIYLCQIESISIM